MQLDLFKNTNSDIPAWIVPVQRLIISKKTGQWCKLPYPNHPKGCPNYGKKANCPPQAPWIYDYFNTLRPMYLVHSEFDLAAHVELMKQRHPDWSDRQCRCVLYWQSKSRKQMKERVFCAVNLLKTNRITACPEAMGLNVFATAAVSGLKMERTRSVCICRHVSLIGHGR